jgi:hypothetical protein
MHEKRRESGRASGTFSDSQAGKRLFHCYNSGKEMAISLYSNFQYYCKEPKAPGPGCKNTHLIISEPGFRQPEVDDASPLPQFCVAFQQRLKAKIGLRNIS